MKTLAMMKIMMKLRKMTHDFSDSFKPLITKVWKMVNMFCRSPVKNDALQKYVKIIHEKELQVIADSKCRWNSLLAMLKRFNLLKKEIQKALLDISQMELYIISVKEENALKDLIDVLESLKVGSVNMFGNECSLLESDKIFEFTI